MYRNNYKRKTISYENNDLKNNLFNSSNINPDTCYIYNKYENLLNCDKIIIADNHIYFYAIISQNTIDKLKEYIQSINSYYQVNKKKLTNSTIYLHINSKGGNLKLLMSFLNFKNELNMEITSVIEKECNDAAILLASICDYRIIKKNATCNLSSYNHCYSSTNFPYYWSYFKQCNNNIDEIMEFKNTLYLLFCNISDSKITSDKLDKYLHKNNSWNSKKYKKIGLADEII
tara:strand:+ start:1524 stop:2216 length:693 start_codon:yes stop_codon:yes gene_type:complete